MKNLKKCAKKSFQEHGKSCQAIYDYDYCVAEENKINYNEYDKALGLYDQTIKVVPPKKIQ